MKKAFYFWSLLTLGYLSFEVLISHIGFILTLTINKYTLPVTFGLYIFVVFASLFLKKSLNLKRQYLISILLFIVSSACFFFIAKNNFSQTYDTSWDGQGYHSSGIISLAKGWNPIYQRELPVKLPDAGILVKGYPKALWIIQSIIYSTTGSINSAKVTNLIILMVAITLSYVFLCKLKINNLAALILAILIVIQPHFLTQIFSFMEDGFSYELLVCTISILGIFVLEPTLLSAISFIFSTLLLVDIKYSNLPIALIIFGIFILLRKGVISTNDQANSNLNVPMLPIILASIIILWVPYVSNIIQYNYILFPTNFKEISKAPSVDNVPLNIQGRDRVSLLFYGIFSKSQSTDSGNNLSKSNVATLKVPFTFLPEEAGNLSMYNNRVGSGGPLFSGVFLFSLFLLITLFATSSRNTRKWSHGVLITVLVIFVSCLVSPAPNLFRYNGQIFLIPFVIIIGSLTIQNKSKIQLLLTWVLILIIIANAALFTLPIIKTRLSEINDINKQLSQIKHSNKTIDVNVKNFYSNYIRLQEAGIPFKITDRLACKDHQILLYTSYTTSFCPEL